MGSPWTDKSAILRDLSFAQGRWVPGGIDTAVAGGKPPAHNITEDTEEEYFRHWTTDGDFSSGPDLIRIKKMLELIQDEEVPDEEIPIGPIEIRKLDLSAPMFKPKKKDDTKENKNPVPNKPRRARNVAIASIMALANQFSTVNQVDEPLKLSKPEDFMTPKQNDEEIQTSEHEHRRKNSVNKVTNWLQSQDITSMFKKKPSVNLVKENIEQNNNVTVSENVSKFKISPVQSDSVKSPNSGQYTPSSWAKEYYKKAVDRSHVRDLVREDVWSRAEKIMKEIDIQKAEAFRKQQEEEALAAAMAAAEEESVIKADAIELSENTSNADKNNNPEGSGIGDVLLAKTRHELINCDQFNCIVCKVLTVQPRQFTVKVTVAETPEQSDPDFVDKLNTSESKGNSDANEGYFGLIKTRFVENLQEPDPELLCSYLSESGSSDEMDF